MQSTTLAILMACHNRCDTTLRCLGNLKCQQGLENVRTSIYLVDDGSTDQTAQQVRQRHGDVIVLEGDGNLFWSGAMSLAFGRAMEDGHDYYLWLNDDVALDDRAISRLLAVHRRLPSDRDILVGATRDGRTDKVSYGGYIHWGSWNPLRFRLIEPAVDRPVPCEVMNGQCVLIPHSGAQKVGNIDARFAQNFGDYDYALRARKKGCNVWLAPQYVGTCDHNACGMLWREATVAWRERWRLVKRPRAFPPGQLLRYTRRHAGWLWPILFLQPYLRALFFPIRHSPQALQAAREMQEAKAAKASSDGVTL